MQMSSIVMLMTSIVHPIGRPYSLIVDLDADLKGSTWVTNNEGEVLLDFTLSRYQRRARTGHQTLSSDTEEKEERDGK